MKKLSKFFGLLIVLQISGYFFVGLNIIHRKVCFGAPMLVDTSTIMHLGIYTKSWWLNYKEVFIIKSILEPKFGIIDFVEDEVDYYNNYRINPERYALQYDINYIIPFVAIVAEENGTLNYGEEWEIWYAWIFIKWFEVRRIPKGQS